jgi:hypothetical protein
MEREEIKQMWEDAGVTQEKLNAVSEYYRTTSCVVMTGPEDIPPAVLSKFAELAEVMNNLYFFVDVKGDRTPYQWYVKRSSCSLVIERKATPVELLEHALDQEWSRIRTEKRKADELAKAEAQRELAALNGDD